MPPLPALHEVVTITEPLILSFKIFVSETGEVISTDCDAKVNVSVFAPLKKHSVAPNAWIEKENKKTPMTGLDSLQAIRPLFISYLYSHMRRKIPLCNSVNFLQARKKTITI